MHIEQVSSSLRNILEKALNGKNITLYDGYELIEAPTDSVPAICEVASQLRNHTKGQIVTYSRKVFIPLTTLCRDSCGYCTFAKPPDHPDAITLLVQAKRKDAKKPCLVWVSVLNSRMNLPANI